METLRSALLLITPKCFMGSVDLTSAYYTVPIAEEDQKFLKFIWHGQRYAFTCYPNGLSQAPRNFTKLTKPIFATLRQSGFVSSNYLDDCILVGDSKDECQINIQKTVELFDMLGFAVHPQKSVLEPTQVITYLGFIINSKAMTISLSLSEEERKTVVSMLVGVREKVRNY